MDSYTKELVFVTCFFGLLGICAIIVLHSFIKELKKRKKDYENLDKPMKKAPTEKVRAKAVNKYSNEIYSGGYKNPSHRIGYFVTFETEDGKTITFDVGEKQFHRIKAYSTANLVTSEGNFIDFK